jgi:hypothetical protein
MQPNHKKWGSVFVKKKSWAIAHGFFRPEISTSSNLVSTHRKTLATSQNAGESKNRSKIPIGAGEREFRKFQNLQMPRSPSPSGILLRFFDSPAFWDANKHFDMLETESEEVEISGRKKPWAIAHDFFLTKTDPHFL